MTQTVNRSINNNKNDFQSTPSGRFGLEALHNGDDNITKHGKALPSNRTLTLTMSKNDTNDGKGEEATENIIRIQKQSATRVANRTEHLEIH